MGGAAMEKEQDILWEMADVMPMGMFILDAQGNYLYTNQEYRDMVMEPEEFFRGQSIPKLKKMGYLATNVWEQVMEKRRTVVAVVSITDASHDRVYDTLTIGVPRFGPDGEIERIIYRQEALDRLNERLRKGVLNKHQFLGVETVPPVEGEHIIAESPQMKEILNTLSVVSKTDASILVMGPSGSGKEVLARRVHRESARQRGPLVVLNCAAIPESLMESELFGYEKGAFTGAIPGGKKGLIEAADGGTLFLDEINSMSLPVQTKLLRVLETKQVTRLGAVAAKSVDFRLVCASNEDLRALVEKGSFRSDLFYRINVISLSIPPLRERKEDILPLAAYFVENFCKKYQCMKVLSGNAIRQLEAYDWPGNVRELRNTVERSVIMSPPQEWEIGSVSVEHREGEGGGGVQPQPSPGQGAGGALPALSDYDGDFSLRGYMDRCEEALLRDMLEKFRSPREIARRMKIDLSNVYRKLQKYQLLP